MSTGETVVFLHAHPDDESIFTGGTIRRLADRGVRTVVVIAAAGLAPGAGLGCAEAALVARRADEARAACDLLGVDALHLLGYQDAGVDACDDAVARLADVLRAEGATALVTYDDGGIYPHPDHLAVHRLGVAAAAAAGVDVVYEATVDREYLHFVETHLVGLAALSMHEAVPTGVPTVLVSTTVDVTLPHASHALSAYYLIAPAEASYNLARFDETTWEPVQGGLSGPVYALASHDASQEPCALHSAFTISKKTITCLPPSVASFRPTRSSACTPFAPS